MKKIIVNAYSFDEAKQVALNNGLTIVRNVTPSYNKEKDAEGFDFDSFAESTLVKHKLDKSTGVGCIVIQEAGSADTRERPYKFENNITEGNLTKKRVFQVRTADDDTLVAEADNKAFAARLAKSAMKVVKKDLVCKQVYKVDDQHELAFSLKYTPSLKTKLGTYIIFGNE